MLPTVIASATRWASVFAVGGALIAGAPPAVAADGDRTVLVVYSRSRLLPANLEIERGIREAIHSSPERGVTLFDEFLDQPRFEGPDYDRTMATYLRQKYAVRPPDVVMAVNQDALQFLVRHRSELFPRAPIVHLGVSVSPLRSLAPMPPNVIGVPIAYDSVGTIDIALRWHPQARRVVVVTGTAVQDRAWEARLRTEAERFRDRATFEFVTGLPTDAVLRRLRDLDSEAIVFTPGYFRDGAGRQTSPRDVCEAMAGSSAVPIYAPFDTFIGTGVVGGNMPTYAGVGRQAGEIVNALLEGAAPASLTLPTVTPSRLIVDWRQLRRWNIDESNVPSGADVRFGTPSLLETHWNETVIALVLLVLQAGLIAILVAERYRRRAAERAVQEHRSELVHASRLAVAGELTASIAHEINQPLGAILSNADAADLILEGGGDRRDELRAILSDIRRDDLRASEVIRRLRTLLAKHQVERESLDVVDVVRDIEPVLRAEAERRGVALDIRSDAGKANVVGDRVQIQQVLINVVINAMDSVAEVPEDRRSVAVAVERTGAGIAIVVRDRGHGIAPEDLPRLFDSFFSTKRKGMGLGLSIARTIVESHGGHISATNLAGGGAIFCIELPVVEASSTTVAVSV